MHGLGFGVLGLGFLGFGGFGLGFVGLRYNNCDLYDMSLQHFVPRNDVWFCQAWPSLLSLQIFATMEKKPPIGNL